MVPGVIPVMIELSAGVEGRLVGVVVTSVPTPAAGADPLADDKEGVLVE